MAWIYLLIAGFFEIAWLPGLKLSQTMESNVPGIALAVVSMTLSGVFLWLAQRTSPIGAAYAVRTGTGASGTFIVVSVQRRRKSFADRVGHAHHRRGRPQDLSLIGHKDFQS